jgi:hypothetical protein
VSGRQTLAIDEGRGAVSFDDPARPAPSAPPPPREAPATGGAPREAPGIPAAPPPRRRVERAGAPPPRLRELLVRGQVEAVVEAAHRQGVARALATAELPDLVALGDAARYLRRDDLARRALLATRARFPRAPEARDAAFLLGRLEEGGAKDANGAAVALAWYDRYLAGGEAGDYAAEALGRKMVLLDRLEGRPRARAAAAAYLARFPHGSYASAARALLAGP